MYQQADHLRLDQDSRCLDGDSTSISRAVGVYPRAENSIPQDLATILVTTTLYRIRYYRIQNYILQDLTVPNSHARTHTVA